MNKNKIIKYLFNNKRQRDINKEILKQLEKTKFEIDAAISMFNSVNDFKLIEVAIYAEKMAKNRYDYLLTMAKARGIKVSDNYILTKNISIK